MSKDKHIVEDILDYAVALGYTKINETDGIWVHDVDQTWTIKCNPHKEELEGIPPLHFSIEFNGWPAGILSVTGEGLICAGEEGNAENLRKALHNRLEREGATA